MNLEIICYKVSKAQLFAFKKRLKIANLIANLVEARTHLISCTSECSSNDSGHLIHK